MHGIGGLGTLLAVARAHLDTADRLTLAGGVAAAVPLVAADATAGAVALADRAGTVSLSGPAADAHERWEAGVARLPGHAALAAGDVWTPAAGDDLPLPGGWTMPVLALPLRTGARLRGALYAFGSPGRSLGARDRLLLELLAAWLATAVDRLGLREQVVQAEHRLTRMMSITAEIAERRDLSTIAQHVAESLTAATDFRCASVTLREGRQCRRLAAAGLADGRIGLTTEFDRWDALLQPRWQVGRTSYLIPPGGLTDWCDIPDLPPLEDPDAWTADHGLVVVLRDPDGEVLGFLSVDEPRSRRLPDAGAIETLELFARQVEVALAGARLYAALRRAAERDSLTGLGNRRACWDDLAEAVAAASEEYPVSVALVDVDDFKEVNDTHGHAAGDRALRHVADRLRRSVRETDRVYRIGGEEFLVVLPGASTRAAAVVLRRASAAIRQVRCGDSRLTISAGIAQAPRHGRDADGLFVVADAALYSAKRRGKDRVVAAGACDASELPRVPWRL